MKHKTGIIFSLLLAVGCAAGVYFFFPTYNTNRIFSQNIDEAMQLVRAGSLEGGVAKIMHAISVVGGIENAPQDIIRETEKELYRTAEMNPLSSEPVLGYFEKLNLDPGCVARMGMYDRIVKSTYSNVFAKKMYADMGGFLFLAARWGGQCEVLPDSLKKFRAVLDLYKEKMGEGLDEERWMTLAYNGSPVVAAPAKPAPAPKPAEGSQPAPDAGNAAPAAPQEDVKLPEPKVESTKPAPEAAPAKPDKPEGSFTVVESTTAEKKPAPAPEAKPAPAPEKKPAAENKPAGKVKKEPLLKEITLAQGTIITTLKVHDIKVTHLMFRDDGVVIYVTFESGYIGNKKLKDQVEAILDTIYTTVESTGVIPLQHISLKVNDTAGRIVAQLDIEYSDYNEYRTGDIDWSSMRLRWEERIFD